MGVLNTNFFFNSPVIKKKLQIIIITHMAQIEYGGYNQQRMLLQGEEQKRVNMDIGK